MKPLQIIALVLAATLVLRASGQTTSTNDPATGTNAPSGRTPKYANEVGPVHGWIALQAYLLLPAGSLKQEMAGYLPTSAGNPCYGPSFTSLASWRTNPDAVDSSSPGTAVVEGAWEEDVPDWDSKTHFWNPDGGFNAGLYVATPTLYHFDSALLVADAHFRNALIAYQAGQKANAYYLLGRMAHLLADMSVPAHVLRDWHIPWLSIDQDGYEIYTARDGNYTRITSTSLGVSIPNRALLACYFDTPAGFDTDMVNLFFDQAASSQRFDSDDKNGKSTDYGQGKYRLGWDALATGKTLSRAELWNAELGIPTTFNRDLVRFADYDVFTDCDNPQNIRICYYETFFNTYNNHADKRIKAFYTDGSNAFVDANLDEITDIPDSILKCIYQPKLEADAIGHVAALYQLFWDRTHPATPITAPSIASVSPTTLLTSSSPQLITIYGSNFKAAGDPNVSSLLFFDPAGNPYLRTPSYATTTELRYNVTVQSAVGTWRVVVTNAAQNASAPANFTVVAPPPPTSGSLTVTIDPTSARTAGAQWAVDAGVWRNSGDTATGLTPGTHNISCKAIAGYTAPASHSVTITGGAVTSDTETYTVVTPSTYTLTVNYNPEQGGASPSPLVPQTGSTYGSYSFGYAAGAATLVQASASTGYHFTGWSGDASGTANPITVTMNGNKNITANFAAGDPNLGTLTVTIVPPEAAAAGVTWGFNESDFRASGSSVQSWPGTFLIFVNGTNGWIGYPSWITIVAGQTTNVSLSASSTTGSIVGNDPRTYSTLAGSTTNSGSADGVGSAARFYRPWSIAVDGSSNVFVADSWNGVIRKIKPSGEVTTIAGKVGVSGFADGQGTNAIFNNPTGIAVDTSSNLYVADFQNSVIRKITPDGTVSTYAGSAGVNDSVDAVGSAARFYFPCGVAVDTNGNLYVADSVNQTIRKITPGRAVSTLAGYSRSWGTADGSGSAARFHNPEDVAVDNSGNVYVADNVNQTVRKVTPAGAVTTLAGFPGSGGAADGTGNAARFNNMSGVAVDRDGNILVADTGNYAIRKVTQAGVVTTLAGQSGHPGSADGVGNLVRFNSPSDIAVGPSGIMYVDDSMNHTIRVTLPVGPKFDQTITFAAVPDKYVNDLPFALNATASSGLPVTFSLISGQATLSNNVVTLTGTGTITVRASQAGNSTFNAAPNVDRSFVVAKLPQAISFGPLSRQTVGDAPFPLSASASSGLPVSVAIVSGPAVLSGNIVTLTGAGTVVVRASQLGDAVYAPAANVDQAFPVVRGINMITDFSRATNGQFHLVFAGDFSRNYIVEFSTNLLNWAPLTTNTVDSLGNLEFTDTSATNRMRFYRVVPLAQGPMVLQPGPADGQDIWTTSIYSNGTNTSGANGIANENVLVGGWGDYYYAYIKFDLTGLPSHANLATVQLYSFSGWHSGFANVSMFLDRVTQNWDALFATGIMRWADKPAATNLRTISAPAVNNWYSIDITDLYNAWQAGTYPNYGIALRPTGNWDQFNYFWSSRYSGDPTLRPKCVIVPGN